MIESYLHKYENKFGFRDINSKRRRNIHHGTIYKTGDEKTLKFILGVNYKVIICISWIRYCCHLEFCLGYGSSRRTTDAQTES